MSDRGNDPLARLAEAVAKERLSLAPGTPEKYPGTKAHVNLLDLEAALAAVVEVREQFRQSKAEEGGGKAAVVGESDGLDRAVDDTSIAPASRGARGGDAE